MIERERKTLLTPFFSFSFRLSHYRMDSPPLAFRRTPLKKSIYEKERALARAPLLRVTVTPLPSPAFYPTSNGDFVVRRDRASKPGMESEKFSFISLQQIATAATRVRRQKKEKEFAF